MPNVTIPAALLLCVPALLLNSAHAEAPAPPAAADGKVMAMDNAFAVDLYGRLATGKSANVFCSPLSIETALAMTWAGARGETAGQIASVLHLQSDPAAGAQLGAFLRRLNEAGKSRGYELSVANALWGLKRYPFLPAFLKTVETDYGGHLAELDFVNAPDPSRQTINDWVSAQTHNRIKDLLPAGSVTPMTRLVLTNAIYFKGTWDQPFQKDRTQDADFTSQDGHASKVSMMSQQAGFRYAEDDDVQVLELPYGHGDLALRVFLPKAAAGLGEFERGLTDARLSEWANRLTNQQVRVWLPRFKIEAGYKLEEDLQAMGIHLAFNPNAADFSGMTSAEHLSISAVVHKAFVQVDEEGTEAAAATGIAVAGAAVRARPEPTVFRADHPFFFTIVDRATGAILFMGRFASPS